MPSFYQPLQDLMTKLHLKIYETHNNSVDDLEEIGEQLKEFYNVQKSRLSQLKDLPIIDLSHPLRPIKANQMQEVVKTVTQARRLFLKTLHPGRGSRRKEAIKEAKEFYNKDRAKVVSPTVKLNDGSKATSAEALQSQRDAFGAEKPGINYINSGEYLAALQDHLYQGDYMDRVNGKSGILIYAGATSLSSLSRHYLEIPYVPNSFTEDAGASFAKINILNRNNVPYQFINGSTEIKFTIQWFDTGYRLGDAYLKAKKLQLLSVLDGSSFPRPIRIEWGSNARLFPGYKFIVKSAPIKASHFSTAKINGSSAWDKHGRIIAETGMVLPTIIEQEVTLVRIQDAGYYTHRQQISEQINSINPNF